MNCLETGQYYFFDDNIDGEHFRVEGKLIYIFVNPSKDLNAKCLLMAFPVWPESFEEHTFSPDTEKGSGEAMHNEWRKKMKTFPTWRMKWVTIKNLQESDMKHADSFIAPIEDLIKEIGKDIK